MNDYSNEVITNLGDFNINKCHARLTSNPNKQCCNRKYKIELLF